MANYAFSSLANGQHVSFNAATDILSFDSWVTASSLTLAESGGALSILWQGKTIWLDNLSISKLRDDSLQFANGGLLIAGDTTTDTLADWYGAEYTMQTDNAGNWVAGLGGADLAQTGSGSDWLVGNVALTSLNHLSRIGNTGSPNSSTSPTISADGRYVGFAGGWTSFGSQNNSATDVFVKDVTSGTVNNEHKSSAGLYGNSGSGSPVISADGKALAFISASSNLVSGSSSSLYDIYVAGVGTSTIERVSTGTGGTLAANGRSLNPDISGTGRYVAFESSTSNWAAGGSTAQSDIFFKDRSTGTLTRLSTSLTGGDGNGESSSAKISNDGRFVAFESAASNLTSGDTNGYTDIFVWDRNDGSLTNLTSLMTSVTNPNNSCLNPDIAYDNGWGGTIVFETARGLVAGDNNNATDIYAFNMADDTFQLVSCKADGSAVSLSSTDASISGDGRFVVFTSYASNLVAGDTNGVADVFVKDLYTGAIALVSKAANGTLGTLASSNAEISLGGEYIVFETSAPNLSSTDANGSFTDVYRVSNPLLKDTLVGGAGNDTYVINRSDVITEAANGGTDTVRSTITYTLGANLENLALLGTGNLAGTGNSLNNTIYGNAGNNAMNGSTGTDTVSYSYAGAAVTVSLATTAAQATVGAGTDTLSNFENISGSTYNDRLTGDANNNRLDGLAGADTMTGGAGNDTYVCNANTDIIVEAASAGTDTVISAVTWTLGSTLENLTLSGSVAINGTGNSAANVLTGNSVTNTLNGGGANDTVNGGAGNDSLLGGDGNDRLDGGTGNDTMAGGNGDDTYICDSSADVISEVAGTGTDTVISAVTWTLQGTLENLSLSGTASINGSGNSAANVLTGNSVNNILSGGSGNDTISGGAGNDTINSGAGNDSLTGGTGNDTFRFADALSATTNLDSITDYAVANDTIQLENSVFAKLTTTGALAAANFTANSTGTAVDANDYVIYETDTGKLFYDADGNGAGTAIQFALLGSGLAMVAGEFLVT